MNAGHLRCGDEETALRLTKAGAMPSADTYLAIEKSCPFMNYEELPRSALMRLLQEHDDALQQAGRDGIVMSYSGRAAPWQITRLVKALIYLTQ